MQGRLMLTGSSNKDNFEINVERLSAGMYTIRLYNGRHNIDNREDTCKIKITRTKLTGSIIRVIV